VTAPGRGAAFMAGDFVRLAPQVRAVRRPTGLLLVGPGGNPVMVSPLAGEVLHLLVAGVRVGELARELQALRPRAGDTPVKLAVFLDRLGQAGLLEGREAAGAAEPRLKIPVDGLARRVTAAVRPLPPRVLACVPGALAAASLAGLGGLLARPDRPRLTHLRAGATQAVLVLPAMGLLHELGHALACRLIGVPSGPLTLRMSRLGVPRPAVRTPGAWGVEEAARRAWIPAGGPLVDLLTGGAAAWWLLLRGPDHGHSSTPRLLALYALMAVDVGTSPIPVGDGSHLLEALLDDEFARDAALLGRRSPFVRPGSARTYRVVCLTHALASAMLIHRLR
jgi:hypothetical protein